MGWYSRLRDDIRSLHRSLKALESEGDSRWRGVNTLGDRVRELELLNEFPDKESVATEIQARVLTVANVKEGRSLSLGAGTVRGALMDPIGSTWRRDKAEERLREILGFAKRRGYITDEGEDDE